MARLIAVMGESGSGKTTAMRTLDPATTFYIDCDGKGLCWKGWREQYSAERKNYVVCRNIPSIDALIRNVSEKGASIRTIVIDTLNTAMVDILMPQHLLNKHTAGIDTLFSIRQGRNI